MALAGGAEGSPAEDAAVARARAAPAASRRPPCTPPTERSSTARRAPVHAARTACCGPASGTRAGSTVQLRSRSRTVTSAGAPGARLPPGQVQEPRRARCVSRATSVGQVERARAARGGRAERHRRLEPDDAVGGAPSNSPSFSESACGAWSVAMQSMVPSTSASRHGLDVALGPERRRHLARWGRSSRTASSVRSRWCGVTSRGDADPARLARRARAAPRPRSRCARCAGARRVSSASTMSRATITSSAAAGLARRARARWRRSPRSWRRRARAAQSSAWLMIGRAEGQGVLQGPAVELRVHHALAVVGEGHAARLGQLGQLGELLALEPRVTAPIG